MSGECQGLCQGFRSIGSRCIGEAGGLRGHRRRIDLTAAILVAALLALARPLATATCFRLRKPILGRSKAIEAAHPDSNAGADRSALFSAAASMIQVIQPILIGIVSTQAML
jgi:hypothetical protein